MLYRHFELNLIDKRTFSVYNIYNIEYLSSKKIMFPFFIVFFFLFLVQLSNLILHTLKCHLLNYRYYKCFFSMLHSFKKWLLVLSDRVFIFLLKLICSFNIVVQLFQKFLKVCRPRLQYRFNLDDLSNEYV